MKNLVQFADSLGLDIANIAGILKLAETNWPPLIIVSGPVCWDKMKAMRVILKMLLCTGYGEGGQRPCGSCLGCSASPDVWAIGMLQSIGSSSTEKERKEIKGLDLLADWALHGNFFDHSSIHLRRVDETNSAIFPKFLYVIERYLEVSEHTEKQRTLFVLLDFDFDVILGDEYAANTLGRGLVVRLRRPDPEALKQKLASKARARGDIIVELDLEEIIQKAGGNPAVADRMVRQISAINAVEQNKIGSDSVARFMLGGSEKSESI